MSKKYPPGVLSRSTPKLAHSALVTQLRMIFDGHWLIIGQFGGSLQYRVILFLMLDTRHCPGTWIWAIGAMRSAGWVSPERIVRQCRNPCHNLSRVTEEIDRDGSWESGSMGDILLISGQWTGRAGISGDLSPLLWCLDWTASQAIIPHAQSFREKIWETNIYAGWEIL